MAKKPFLVVLYDEEEHNFDIDLPEEPRHWFWWVWLATTVILLSILICQWSVG